MWPLSLFLLFATAAPPQQPLDASQDFFHPKLPLIQHGQFGNATTRNFTDESQRITCFTMRTYVFRRHNGYAPFPDGMSTCTPSNLLQQKRVSPEPRVMFVPLGLQQDEQQPAEQK